MSDTERRPYAQVNRVAACLVDALQPVCHRIEVAGSLRRERDMVGDIEIVAVPKPILNLIGEPTEQTEVDLLLDTWPITFAKRGRKYQQFSFEWQPGWTFKVDLFLPTRETWGVVFMLRTGSPAFSKQMVTAKSYGGYKPDVYTVEQGCVRMAGMLLPTPEETNVFDLWKMKYVQPKDRL